MTVLSVVADIAGQTIAVDASAVEAVVDLVHVVPIPLAPAHIAGLSAIRSQVVTVVDPAVALGFAAQTPQGRALLFSVDGHRYAVRVASVSDVVALPAETVPMLMTDAWSALASGRVALDDDFALRIDPARLVAPVDVKTA